MIKEFTLYALQNAMNHALALDSNMPNKIEALHGKVLKVIVGPLDIYFYITFAKKQLRLLAQYSEEADTIIHSNPIGLIRLSLLPPSKARSLFNADVRITGDVDLGHQIKKLFDELDIDWEGHLAKFTGDVVAYQLGSFARKGLAIKKQITDSMKSQMNDYLHEELRVFPPREEVNDLFHDIDQLVLDVERIQAKINQL